MTEKSYDEMSVAELKESADILGIEYTSKVSKGELLSAIKAMVDGASDEEQVVETVGEVVKGEKRITIEIAENENDTQKVPVGVNGRIYLIQRGVPVSVPESVVEVLNNATVHKWDSEMKKRTSVPSYPYRVVI